ncbi:MAG: LysM peptidoglycan-binding domain-containing protein [Limnochordia bacterium]|jgi:LysM repeat protein
MVCLIFLVTVVTCSATRLGQRILGFGVWGADVFELQMRLRDMGYDVVADGRYGPATKNAVMAFQRSKGIKVDGLVGTETAAHIIARWGTLKHHVKQGDAIASLTRQYGVSAAEIRLLNNLSDDVIRIGQVLTIPAPPQYRVQEGDTIERIAALSNSSPEELAALNQLDAMTALQPGMVLRLPKPSY